MSAKFPGDIELNPGPRSDSDSLLSDITNETSDIIKHNFSIVHYNVQNAGPRSAVGNVSGYRCVSDCRSRGREFDPGPVPYFRGD